jgi:hypothetical protein
MDKTYLDFFNYYMQQFLNELISYFPSTKKGILDNYRALLEGRDMKNDCYVKFFMTKCNDCLAEISKKDVKLFEREQVVLVEGVNFHELWTCPESNEQNRMAIWKYLQLLILLGRRIIPSTQEIVDMLKRVGGTIDTPTPTDLKKAEGDDTEDKESATSGLSSILNMAGGLGGLGNLVGGLTGGAAGEGLANLGNIASTITEGLKGLNFEEIAKQMSAAMPAAAAATGSAENGTPAGTNCPPMNDKGTPGEPGLFNTGLFADLAKDVASTFELPKTEESAESSAPPDISQAFQKFMSGDNPAKMMNLIGKYGARLQQDISTGKLNPAQLLQQATKMMGNGGGGAVPNLQEMAQAMGADQAAMNRVKNATRGDATKERLRAKLEAKKGN